jgi:O-antigen ligase
MIIVGNLPFAIPGWMFIPGFVIPLCVLVRQIDPAVQSGRLLRQGIQLNNPESFERGLIWLAALYVVPIAVIAGTAIQRQVVEWVMGAYVAGVVVSCVVAVTDMVGLTHVAVTLNYQRSIASPAEYAWEGERYAGLSDHPNMLGVVCAISMPLVIYFMSRMRWTWIPAVAFIALSAGALASGSRGAQAVSVLTVLGAILCLPSKRTTIRAVSVSAMIMTAAGVVLLYTVLSDYRRWLFRFSGGGDPFEAQRSNESRLGLLEQGWSDFQQHPLFGAGIGHITEAHNIYLQLLAAGGVVLAAGLLAYFFFILRDCWRLSRRGIILARFLMISIATWLVLGMIENEIVDRELYFAVGCVAALVATTKTARLDDCGRLS